jgi:acetoin utilization deacetylase AcuC-like enzyme
MATRIYYSPDYVCEGLGVDTRTKSALIAQSLIDDPIENLEVWEPRPATVEQVARVHDPRYVEAMATGRPEKLAGDNGIGEWSSDLSRSIFSMTGGVIASAVHSFQTKLNSGSLASGLHHAKFDHGMGFCTFNGLVVAAKEAIEAGARRVLIVDFDAHAGGGTAELIRREWCIEQLDVSVAAYDMYEERDDARLTLSNGRSYLKDVRESLALVAQAGEIDLILYNAGMDPHQDCTTGGAQGITTQVLKTRERLVFEWAADLGVPVSFVLAGGYSGRCLSKEKLTALHRLTIEAATL